MKSRTLAALLLCVVLAACGKPNDVPQMQSEATYMATSYAARFDAMRRRAEDLMRRGRVLTGNVENMAEASAMLMQANRKLGELRADAQKATTDIANAAKVSRDELGRTHDELREKLENGATEVNRELDSVEAWMFRAETPVVATGPAGQGAMTPPNGMPAAGGTAAPAGTTTPPSTTPQPQPVHATQQPTTGTPAAPAQPAVGIPSR